MIILMILGTMFMIIGGGVVGAIIIILGEMILKSWIEKYQMWKFTRKFKIK